jgi:hypothetical protein
VAWEKDHWRLDRRRLARVATTPEEIGLCGCWQVVAVRREREELDPRAKPPSDEIGYYATSLTTEELTEDELLEVIRNHWSAIENGVHHRRDVSFGEDACRVAQRSAAHALATLRNLVERFLNNISMTYVSGTLSSLYFHRKTTGDLLISSRY